jgi:hypothetical protein
MYAVQSNVHVGLEPAGYLIDKSVNSSNNDALETAKLMLHLLAIKKNLIDGIFRPLCFAVGHDESVVGCGPHEAT